MISEPNQRYASLMALCSSLPQAADAYFIMTLITSTSAKHYYTPRDKIGI